MIQYTDIMSTEIESKLSATIVVSQWFLSILSAAIYRLFTNTVNSYVVLLAATSLSCLLGTTFYCYYTKVVPNKSATNSSIPKIATSEESKIESAPVTIAKPMIDEFADIDLVPTDDIESDSDGSEQDDWHEATYNQRFSAPPTNNVVSDNGADDNSEEENDDEGDWNEEDYKTKFPASKPVVTRRSTVTKAKSSATTTTSSKKPAQKKKETLAQMRKRVAREMKESEERKRQQSKPARWAPTKKPSRKETVAEMKARVAREFAAKLKK